MNEEKKYTIIGKVEIGSDEYRDLIMELMDAKKDYHEASLKNSDYYWKVKKLEEENERLKVYEKFVTEKCMDSYKLWKIETENEA